jgi:hypothetical protein
MVRVVLLLSGWLVSLSLCPAQRPERKPVTESLQDYRQEKVDGFTVYFHHEIFTHDNAHREQRYLGDFRNLINELNLTFTPEQRQKLQAVTIWVEWDQTDPKNERAIAVYRHGAPEVLEFHGILPEKAYSVNVLSMKKTVNERRGQIPNPANVMLHEFAHAYHHQALGSDLPDIKHAYDQAMARNLYDRVKVFWGKETHREKAYATTNPSEYFAELSEAYLLRNDYFPYTREDLEKHDPIGYQLMVKAWGGKFAVPKTVVAETKPMTPAPTGGDPNEANAAKKLALAKQSLGAGNTKAARERLAEIVKLYPKTKSGKEAADLLDALPSK